MGEQEQFHKQNKKNYEFVNSEHWQFVKEYFQKEISDIENINNVDGNDEKEVFLDLKVRKNLVLLLKEFLQNIEGQAIQYKENELSQDEIENSYIVRNV